MTADLDRIYAEQGYFTEEQLFDVHITSAEQFRTEFLPKIAETIRNSGDKYKINAQRYVTPMLVTAGADRDTWDFMGKIIPGLLGAGANSFNSNFSYWDTSTQRIESMLYQDFYKDEVYEWAKMIYDGTVVSDTQMNTNYSTIQSEYNSGYYAIGYLSGSMPSSRSCQWKDMTTGETRTVNYRKLYLDIPTDWSRFAYMGSGEPAVSSVKFLKSRVREDELPQLLRWLDFQCSRTADQLYAWGASAPPACSTRTRTACAPIRTARLPIRWYTAPPSWGRRSSRTISPTARERRPTRSSRSATAAAASRILSARTI